MAKRGKPFKYKTPEEMQEKIDEYFKDCEGHLYIDEYGHAVLDKSGYPVIVDRKPLTVTGLALALGFTSRQALLNYQHRTTAFQEVVERAKLRIENYAEMRLYDKDGSNGARFNLQCNFRHWNNDTPDSENGGKEIVIVELTRKNPPPPPIDDSAEEASENGTDI